MRKLSLHVNIDTSTLSLQASTLTAEQATIVSEIIELVSLKNSEYESHFSDKSGMMTRTIASKGHIKEEVVPALIEVRDQLLFNGEDITHQLQTENLLKTLSSEYALTHEQIHQVKAILDNQMWDDKTTSLSGLGSLIVAVVVTVVTMGAGAGVAGLAAAQTTAASTAAVAAATGTAAATAAAASAASALTIATVQAAIAQSLITGVTTQLATSAITGNSFKLDTDALIKGAVTAGVLSYVDATFTTNALQTDMGVYDYAKNAVVRGTAQGISAELMGGEFKDGFTAGATLSVVSDGALQMRKYQETNYDYPGKNDENAIEITRTNLTGNPSILGNRELAGAFSERVIDEYGEIKHLPVMGLTGGYVFGDRTLFGVKIDKTGFFGYVLENFAGPHDFMSSWNYQNIDGQTSLINNGLLTEIGSGLLLIPAAPFAAGTFIQDNYQYIQDVRHFLNENKEKQQEAINKTEDNK